MMMYPGPGSDSASAVLSLGEQSPSTPPLGFGAWAGAWAYLLIKNDRGGTYTSDQKRAGFKLQICSL